MTKRGADETQRDDLRLSSESCVFLYGIFLSKACVISPFPPKKTVSIERDSLREVSELQGENPTGKVMAIYF